MALFSQKSLRIRINTSLFIVCLFLTILTVVAVIPYEQKRKETRLSNIEILLQAVFQQKREALANELFSGQTLAMQKTILDILEVKQVRRVELYRLDGSFLMATDEEESNPLAIELREKLDSAHSFSLEKKDGTTCAVFDSLIEIIGEKTGYIRIYYDLDDLQKELYQMGFLLFGIFFILLVGGAIVANLTLSRTIIEPIAQLSSGIRKVREGGLGEQVNIDSEDEIGSMAADFNEMSRKLYQQNVELLGAISEKDESAEKLAKINHQLEVLNSELEERVAERTAELTKMYEHLSQEMRDRQQADEEKRELQEKLARSKKMEALGLLAGGVAHDLNNVLSGIVSYPDLLLLQLDEDSPLKKPVAIIQKSGQKASAIVQDLLTLARRSVLTKEIININDIVKSYLDSPEHKLVMKHHPGVALKVKLDKQLLPIHGSAIHLSKTIMNLVSNAAEAQPKGGEIIIETANHYQDLAQRNYDYGAEGEYALLRVSDRGSGIAKEDQERIFEPFYTKKILGRSGTGLGMAVVWGAVQDHEGFIDVQSQTGKGTTLELFFPATRENVEEELNASDQTSLQGNGEKILIVDDVEEQREITTAILEHLNYSVYSVESGEEAIKFIQKLKFDLLVLDMIMEPGMDGLETYRRIIQNNTGQKAIIASGFAENERVKEAIRLGVSQYIRKPFTLEYLGFAVKRVLES